MTRFWLSILVAGIGGFIIGQICNAVGLGFSWVIIFAALWGILCAATIQEY